MSSPKTENLVKTSPYTTQATLGTKTIICLRLQGHFLLQKEENLVGAAPFTNRRTSAGERSFSTPKREKNLAGAAPPRSQATLHTNIDNACGTPSSRTHAPSPAGHSPNQLLCADTHPQGSRGKGCRPLPPEGPAAYEVPPRTHNGGVRVSLTLPSAPPAGCEGRTARSALSPPVPPRYLSRRSPPAARPRPVPRRRGVAPRPPPRPAPRPPGAGARPVRQGAVTCRRHRPARDGAGRDRRYRAGRGPAAPPCSTWRAWSAPSLARACSPG